MSKHLINKLISEILNEYVFEAEEKAPTNPFAAPGADAGGDAAAADEAEPAADGADAKDEKDTEKKEGGGEDALSFSFDIDGVKRYNKAHFINSKAVAKKITKDGIIATVEPDGVNILVGFDDITESAKKFFKVKK